MTVHLLKKSKPFILNLLGAVIIFIVISTALDYWRGKHLPEGNIPTAEYTDINGQVFNLNTLTHNELTIVYFWATWCGPCKVTSPSIKQLAKHYSVVTIAMASGEDAKLRSYFKDNALPIINDDSQAISKQWGVQVTPTILFIKNKQILGHTTGISGLPGLWLRAWWFNLGD